MADSEPAVYSAPATVVLNRKIVDACSVPRYTLLPSASPLPYSE